MATGSERLNVQRSAFIFQDTPQDILSELARSLVEVRYEAGVGIFKKADYGESMYIVVEGKVKVHDGELLNNYLGRLEVFGEMPALDPEPRSASVTALEDTRLYKLSQSAMIDVMVNRSEVGKGIIRILCQKLRERARDLLFKNIASEISR